MAEPILVTPNQMADPMGCLPGNRQELANFIPTAITATFNGAQFSLFVTGSATPAPENQDRAWFRTTTGGLPLGWYWFFNGKWRKVTGLPPDAIINYSGPASNFDGTGKGLAGSVTESFFICNGQNGTPDLRNRFVVGADEYNGNWTSNVDPDAPDAQTGGFARIRLQKTQIPQLQFTLPIGSEGGNLDRFVVDNATNGGLYERNIPGTGNGEEDSGNGAAPHNNCPPYYALAYIQYKPFV